MFRSDHESPKAREVSTEGQGILASRSYDLLHRWRETRPARIPGTKADGTIDFDLLSAWVSKARDECRESGHLGVCDEQIGEVLAQDIEPDDPTAGWPCEAIRDLLEEVNSESMTRGFEIGIFNKRGATWRSLTEGGSQERELSDKHRTYANAIQDEWPLIAASLRHVAEGYDHDAAREDEEAKRRL